MPEDRVSQIVAQYEAGALTEGSARVEIYLAAAEGSVEDVFARSPPDLQALVARDVANLNPTEVRLFESHCGLGSTADYLADLRRREALMQRGIAAIQRVTRGGDAGGGAVTDENDSFDAYRELTEYADHLNSICRPRWFAGPFYEVLSGAVIWTDEKKRKTPVKVVWSLRFLWAYRTSVMLNEPREELAEYWRFGLSKFPEWVGFRPERRLATPRLLRIYREGEASVRELCRLAME
jgi:hypothetical protein